MICCTKNNNVIYYLHSNKKMTIFDINRRVVVEMEINSKSFPHLIENYRDGVVYAHSNNQLGFLGYDFELMNCKQNVIQFMT